MTTFTLTWPLDRVNNPNRRGQHWARVAKWRAEMRQAAFDAAQGLDRIDGPCELTMTFAFPDNRPRDLDNYEIKGAIDGAVDAGLITDDRSTVLRSVTRRVGSGKSPRGFVVMVFDFTATECAEDRACDRMNTSHKAAPGGASTPDSGGLTPVEEGRMAKATPTTPGGVH